MGQFKAYESLLMLNGDVAPPEVVDGDLTIKPTLFDLVTQIALEQAIDFYENPKDLGDEPTLSVPPTPAEEAALKDWNNAQRYQSKTYRVSDRIIENDVDTFRRLVKVVRTQFSVSYNLGQFIDKTINVWENRITEVMKRAIEIVGKVKDDEKTAYEAV